MPPSRLSPDERAARLTMQALKVQTAGKLKVIKEALQTNPQYVANIYEKCEHLGIIASGEAKGAPAGRTSQSPGKQPTHSAKLPLASSPEAVTPTRAVKAEGGDDEGTPAAQPDGHDERAQQDEASGSGGASSCNGSEEAGPAGALVPSKYWKFDAMSAIKLKEFLEFMEPVVFSKFAIRAISSKKGSSKSTLLELLEFATGLEPQHSIVGKLRSELVLKGELKALNEANGRRCQGLRLPPLWATQGVYRLLLDTAGPKKLLNQYTQKSIIVPESVEKKVASLERCTIEQNWSENNAYLLDEDGTATLKIKDLFLTCAPSDESEPQAKKARTKDPDSKPAVRPPGNPTVFDDEVPPPGPEALTAAAVAE